MGASRKPDRKRSATASSIPRWGKPCGSTRSSRTGRIATGTRNRSFRATRCSTTSCCTGSRRLPPHRPGSMLKTRGTDVATRGGDPGRRQYLPGRNLPTATDLGRTDLFQAVLLEPGVERRTLRRVRTTCAVHCGAASVFCQHPDLKGHACAGRSMQRAGRVRMALNRPRHPHCIDQAVFYSGLAGSHPGASDPARQDSRIASIKARTRAGTCERLGKTAHIPTSRGSTSVR